MSSADHVSLHVAADSPSRIPRQRAVVLPTTAAAAVTFQQQAPSLLLWVPCSGFIWSMLSEQLYRWAL